MSFGEAKENANFVTQTLDERVLILRMVDAETKNGLSSGMVSALMAGFDRAKNEDVHCVVLCGSEHVFSSGATKDVLDALIDAKIEPDELGLGLRIVGCPVPVVAACRGWAVGGGFALALSCDFVVLASERRYGFNFMDLGITPGMASTVLAERFFSKAIAQELLFSGELRRGAKFDQSGINHIEPSDDVEARAFELAHRIAEKPRTSITLLKNHFNRERVSKIERALSGEIEMHQVTLQHLDLSNFGEKS